MTTEELAAVLATKRRTYYLAPEHFKADSGAPHGDDETNRREAPVEEATLISSECAEDHDPFGDTHYPVLDLDFRAHLVPSSTKGHFHLYLDKELSWDAYRLLLCVLAHVGILEPGYVDASLERRATFVRKPGVTK